MRRVSQRFKVDVDERGVRKKGSFGDCVPACLASIFELPIETFGDRDPGQKLYDFLACNYAGITHVTRYFKPTPDPPHHPGFWIAGVLSARFKEECHNCSPERETSEPQWDFWRRDECPWCDGTGLAAGWHAVVMENRQRVWDPHPDVDWNAPVTYVSETVFVVGDPSKLQARTMPVAISS
jgi:hypothetical protein